LCLKPPDLVGINLSTLIHFSCIAPFRWLDRLFVDNKRGLAAPA
jgi:hypothetical protein